MGLERKIYLFYHDFLDIEINYDNCKGYEEIPAWYELLKLSVPNTRFYMEGLHRMDYRMACQGSWDRVSVARFLGLRPLKRTVSIRQIKGIPDMLDFRDLVIGSDDCYHVKTSTGVELLLLCQPGQGRL